MSLPSHLKTQHGIYQSKVLEEEYLAETPEVVYECNQCGLELAALSLPSHLKAQHGVYQSEVLEEEYLAETPEVLYECEQLAVVKCQCPHPGYTGKAVSKWGMQRHLCTRHQ